MTQAALHTVSKSRLSSDVAWQIELAIKSGQFRPGEKLPPERELSRSLGVSRPILRQALQDLEARGLVDIQHGRGTFVASLTGQFVSPITWLKQNSGKVNSYYEARMAMEPVCAQLAARRGTEGQIGELRANVQQSKQVAIEGDVLAFIALDIEFHNIIAHMSGNPHLYHALNLTINPETDARQVIHRLPGHLSVAQRRHEKVLEAIMARDDEGAREAMMSAFSGVIRDLEELE